MVRRVFAVVQGLDVSLTVKFSVIVEKGVKLRLNIVDTPGYGDQVNNENWCVVYFPFVTCPYEYRLAGIPLSSTSRTSTARTSARS
jgi:hypothetical protein